MTLRCASDDGQHAPDASYLEHCILDDGDSACKHAVCTSHCDLNHARLHRTFVEPLMMVNMLPTLFVSDIGSTTIVPVLASMSLEIGTVTHIMRIGAT